MTKESVRAKNATNATYQYPSKIAQLSSKEKERNEGENRIHRGRDTSDLEPFEEN